MAGLNFSVDSYVGRLWRQLELLLQTEQNQDAAQDHDVINRNSETLMKNSARFVLKLFNDTFISLPLLNCHGVNKILDSNGEYHHLESHLRQDACQVDWLAASIIKASNFSSSFIDLRPSASAKLTTSNNQSYDLFDCKNLNTFDLDHFVTSTNQTNHSLNHYNQIINSSNNQYQSTIIEFNIPKLTYLLISSLLSISGMFINLLIFLMIIFSGFKQKNNLIVRGACLTNRANPLLIQMAITGILLTSYILYDNIEIYNQLDYNYNKSDRLQMKDVSGRYNEQRIHMEIISPISMILPPTPSVDYMNNRDHKLNSITAIQNHFETSEFNNLGKNFIVLVKFNLNLPQKPKTKANILMKNNYDDYDKFNHDIIKTKDTIIQENYPDFGRNNEILSNDLPNSFLESMKFATLNDCFWSKLSLIENSSISQQDCKSDTSEGGCNDLKYDKYAAIGSSLPILLINVIGSVHLWTLAALAYDRHCAIAHPLQYLRTTLSPKLKTFIVVLWLSSLLVGLIIPIGLHSYKTLNGKSRFIPKSCIRIEQAERLDTNNVVDTYIDNSTESMQSQQLRFRSSKGTEWLYQYNWLLVDRRNIINLFEITKNLFINGNYDKEISRSTEKKQEMSEKVFELLTLALADLTLESSENFTKTLLGQSVKETNHQSIGFNLFVIFLMTYSIFGFVAIILVPLLIITICNISIYGIVRIHERRLSTSSGSNFGNSSLQIANNNIYNNISANNQKNKNQFRRDTYLTDDDEAILIGHNSLVHKIINRKLFQKKKHASALKNFDYNSNKDTRFLSTMNKYGSNDKIVNLNNSIKKQAIEDIETNKNIVNRSSRVITRQDSYQLVAELKAKSDLSEKTFNVNNETSLNLQANDLKNHYNSQHNQPPRATKMKRKISDHRLTFAPISRKSSDTSTQTEGELCRDREDSEVGSTLLEASCALSSGDRYDSVGIINQLKMAGLSFAGIAIHEVTDGSYHHKMLNRSTSCSLGDLSAVNPNWSANSHCYCGTSVSRCSVETGSIGVNHNQLINQHNHHKKTIVSLNANAGSHLSKIQDLERYSTRLLDSDSESTQCALAGSTAGNQNRLAFFIGTKSASFNVIIWLILTLLIFLIPQYFLMVTDQLLNFNGISEDYLRQQEQILKDSYDSSLKLILSAIDPSFGNFLQLYQSYLDQIDKNSALISRLIKQSHSIWLSYISRILFLTMVPMNAWLYGIRSRSLKEAIRMDLKRYISRRQASIEINQRQRSLSSSIRSRDSSISNMQPCCVNHNQCLLSSNIQPDVRTIRRCSSLNSHRRDRDSSGLVLINDASNAKADEPKLSQQLNMSQPNSPSAYQYQSATIRFAPEDLASGFKKEAETTLTSPNQTQTQTNISLDSSSSVGSNKSLVTDFMGPSHIIRQQYQNNELDTESRKLSNYKKDSQVIDHHKNDIEIDFDLRPQKPNEFKFYITSDEFDQQKVDERVMKKLSPSSHQGGCNTSVYREICPKLDSLNKTNHKISNAWKYLKSNLTRVMLRNSDGAPLMSLAKDDETISRYHSHHHHNHHLPSEQALISSASEDYKELCPLVQPENATRHESESELLDYKKINHHISKNSPFSRIRNSLTFGNISDSSSNNFQNQTSGKQLQLHQQQQHFQLLKSTSVKNSPNLFEKQFNSSGHLKPPNFLKLALDHDLHHSTAIYSSASALSPIKEHSSNHSYASSQSSLNNNIAQTSSNQLIGQLNRNRSMNDLNKEPEFNEESRKIVHGQCDWSDKRDVTQ